MKHIGNLRITENNVKEYTKLVEVTGSLTLDSEAKLETALKEINKK